LLAQQHFAIARVERRLGFAADLLGQTVNKIQEQFFVFFLRPDADGMVMSAEYARRAQDLLILPGVWGSDVPILDYIPFLERLVAHREAYRKLRADQARKLRPAGYTIADIWNGDGHSSPSDGGHARKSPISVSRSPSNWSTRRKLTSTSNSAPEFASDRAS
jgi:hypothetical protein